MHVSTEEQVKLYNETKWLMQWIASSIDDIYDCENG